MHGWLVFVVITVHVCVCGRNAALARGAQLFRKLLVLIRHGRAPLGTANCSARIHEDQWPLTHYGVVHHTWGYRAAH